MTEGIKLLQPEALIFLWIPAAAVIAGVCALIAGGRSFRKFFPGRTADADIHSLARRRRIIKSILIAASLLLIVTAAARPAWDKTEKRITKEGRDVVFVVDVSRSMLAEDLYPNRLERAKLSILDALGVIDGDRVALVAFAGTAVVKCPLTLDYGFFRQAVDALSPEAVSVGGSLIGDALRTVLSEVVTGDSGGEGGFRDVILITDGEDQQSYPEKAAEMLADSGIRLIAVGLGDENEGRRIPVTDADGRQVFLSYQGREIWSRLDARTLRKMAGLTPGGRYLNVSTAAFDMGEIYSDLIKSGETRATDDQVRFDWREGFQYLLFPAFLLLLAAIFISSLPVPGRKG